MECRDLADLLGDRAIGNPKSELTGTLIANRESAVASTLQPLVARFMRTPEAGADTLVWLAVSDEGAHPRAVYYADRKPGHMSKAAQDGEAAARLWDVSTQLVGIA